MNSVVLAVLALLLPLHGAAQPQTWEDVSLQTAQAAIQAAPTVAGGFGFVQPLDLQPRETAPLFLAGSLGAGPAQTGVPCIACVKKVPTKNNIGLTGPSNYVPTGAVWQYTLSMTDITFVGGCKLSWAISAGRKVIDTFASPTITFKTGGGYALYGYNRNRPNYSGPAILLGKVLCGGIPSSTQMNIYFQ